MPSWLRWVVPAVSVVLFLGVAVLLGQEAGPTPPPSPVDVAAMIAPYLALALAIERFWEAVFSWYESLVLATGKTFGTTAAIANWMEREVRKAEIAVAEAAEKGAEPHGSEAIALAEAQLTNAKARIEETIRSPQYVGAKRAVTVIGSLTIGVALSLAGHFRMFLAVGLPLPEGLDVVMTGIAIGTGSGPMHSLVGLLQELRNAVGGVADLARGGAVRTAMAALSGAVQNAEQPAPSPPPASLRSVSAVGQTPLPMARQAHRVLRTGQ
ncbi:MAG: hypothetical protein ABMB14_28380 [Myxococcota bacterium]